MTKEQKITFNVEGPDWSTQVQIDPTIHEDEASQLFEAGTLAIENMIKDNDDLNLGAILLVKKSKSSKEALVNTYICLNNASKFELAEDLREKFKKTSNGQDLALDEKGYSY